MNKKSLAAAVLTGLMALSLIGCGGGDKKTEQKKAEPAKDGKKIVLRVAYENNKTEPVGVAWEKAKEIILKYKDTEGFGNARFVRTLYEKTIIQHAANTKDSDNPEVLKKIQSKDISDDNIASL